MFRCFRKIGSNGLKLLQYSNYEACYRLSPSLRFSTKQDELKIWEAKERYADKKPHGDDLYEDNVHQESGETVVTILNRNENLLMVNSFSIDGFTLNNGARIIGPCALFPKAVLHWNVRNVEDITEESLSLFTLLEPKLDIFVLGVGERENLHKIDRRLFMYMKSKKINIEILATEQALATYNFLNSEYRLVGAALLPPSYMHTRSQSETHLNTNDDYSIHTPIEDVSEQLLTTENIEGGKKKLKQMIKDYTSSDTNKH